MSYITIGLLGAFVMVMGALGAVSSIVFAPKRYKMDNLANYKFARNLRITQASMLLAAVTGACVFLYAVAAGLLFRL